MSEILVNSLKTAAGVDTLTFDSTGDVLLSTGRIGRVAGNTITIDSDGILNATSVNVSSAITLPAGSIDSDAIGTGAVSANKIANGAVESAMTTQFGRRNLIINGAMQVWQRGTTLNTADYSADRWMQWMTNAGVANRNVNCTKQTGGPLGKNSSYIRYAPQVVDTGMEKFAWGQKIEKINLDNIQSGQQMTLSFWIKKEQDLPVDNNMDIQILRPDNVDGWSSGYLFRGDENIDQTLASISFNSLSTNWTKYIYTFIPSDAVLDNGMAVYWHVGDSNFNLNNTNPLVSFTGVQLEVGTVATPFEHRSYGEELALCQRYYQEATNFVAETYSSSDLWAAYKPTVPFRATPSLSASGVISVDDVAVATYNQSSAAVNLWNVTTNAKAGSGVSFLLPNFTGLNVRRNMLVRDQGGCVRFDAEL